MWVCFWELMPFCRSWHLLEIKGDKILKLFSCNGICISAGVLCLGVFFSWVKQNLYFTHGHFPWLRSSPSKRISALPASHLNQHKPPAWNIWGYTVSFHIFFPQDISFTFSQLDALEPHRLWVLPYSPSVRQEPNRSIMGRITITQILKKDVLYLHRDTEERISYKIVFLES